MERDVTMNVIFTIFLLFSSILWPSAWAQTESATYGELVVDQEPVRQKTSLRVLYGNAVDASFENSQGLRLNGAYALKYFSVGAEFVSNEVELQDKYKDRFEIRSNLPEQMVGATVSLPVLHNLSNLFNWQYFSFRADIELAYGRASFDQKSDEDYLAIGLVIEVEDVAQNFRPLLSYRNIDVDRTQYNEVAVGVGYTF